MGTSWEKLSFSDAGIKLIDCVHKTPPAESDGYLYIAIPQLSNGRIDPATARRISADSFTEWTKKALPQANDVVLSRRCNPGVTAHVPPNFEFALGQNLVLLRAAESTVDPSFLRWLCSGPEWWGQINKWINVGAVFESLKCADVPKFELTIPPVTNQLAIANILGTLDDKIELNRRMNETLESIARAIFKSWFVDFGPVRAKLEGQSHEQQSSPSAYPMPAEVYDLFPSAFQDSELGKIPEGWEVITIGEIGDVVCGKTPPTKKSEYYGDDVPFITIPDMHGEMFALKTNKYLSEAGAASQEKKNLPIGSLCVSCIASPGLVVITHEVAQTNQQINSIIPAENGQTYFWYWTLTGLGHEIRAGGSGGSVLSNLSKSRFEKLKLVTPPTAMRDAYQRRVDPIFHMILSNLQENETLAQLRDTLLPKLLSGELAVPDALLQAEEAL